ncbi:hypothetical protein [Pseudomonas asiatica]|nr:hypothetical protein [Pseudomonas asiatica]MCE0955117.1 hypothetical protein [Pseudomonas asiatica]
MGSAVLGYVIQEVMLPASALRRSQPVQKVMAMKDPRQLAIRRARR